MTAQTTTSLMTRDAYRTYIRELLKQVGDLVEVLEKMLGREFRAQILNTLSTILLLWQQQFETMLQGKVQQQTFEVIGKFFFELLNPERSDQLQRNVEHLPGGNVLNPLLNRTALFFDVTLKRGIAHLNPLQQQQVRMLAHHLLLLIHPGSDALRRAETAHGIHTVEVGVFHETHTGLPILEEMERESPLPEGGLRTALVLLALSPSGKPAQSSAARSIALAAPAALSASDVLPAPDPKDAEVDTVRAWAASHGALRDPAEADPRPVERTRQAVPTLKPGDPSTK